MSPAQGGRREAVPFSDWNRLWSAAFGDPKDPVHVSRADQLWAEGHPAGDLYAGLLLAVLP